VLQEIKNTDPNARRSIHSLAHAIGIPKRTMARMKQIEGSYHVFEEKTE
jgi:hypothetical protein